MAILIGFTALIGVNFTACNEKTESEISSVVNSTPMSNKEPPDNSGDNRQSAYRSSIFQCHNSKAAENAEDEYNDWLDEYLDDPEDELRFDPEIFDFQDD